MANAPVIVLEGHEDVLWHRIEVNLRRRGSRVVYDKGIWNARTDVVGKSCKVRDLRRRLRVTRFVDEYTVHGQVRISLTPVLVRVDISLVLGYGAGAAGRRDIATSRIRQLSSRTTRAAYPSVLTFANEFTLLMAAI